VEPRLTSGGAGELSPWADTPPQRLLWRALEAATRVIGPRSARRIAAGVLRPASRDEHGFTKSLYRVARRLPEPMPDLYRMPEAWWSTAPRVRVQRLGLDMALDLRDNLQRTVYFTGTYEPALLRLLERELREGDVVVDVGAHIGVHALTAARRLRELGGGRVVAFEPAADSAAALRRAADANGLDVEVVQAGLGEEEGTIELFGDPRYGAFDAGVRSQFGQGERVGSAPMHVFDAWTEATGLERLDVVKLDVEGAEILALRGMRETLRRLRPRLVVVEIKDVVMQRGPGDEASLHALMADCGYVATGQVVKHNEVFRPGGPPRPQATGASASASATGAGAGVAGGPAVHARIPSARTAAAATHCTPKTIAANVTTPRPASARITGSASAIAARNHRKCIWCSASMYCTVR
jgi:FkbM family methyltransferase